MQAPFAQGLELQGVSCGGGVENHCGYSACAQVGCCLVTQSSSSSSVRVQCSVYEPQVKVAVKKSEPVRSELYSKCTMGRETLIGCDIHHGFSPWRIISASGGRFERRRWPRRAEGSLDAVESEEPSWRDRLPWPTSKAEKLSTGVSNSLVHARSQVHARNDPSAARFKIPSSSSETPPSH